MAMYTPKMKNGVVQRNRYGMEMIQCNRGTNHTEFYHKGIITTFGMWCTNIEMSDCLLGEQRHRHNHKVSEQRRPGLPVVGNYDTWLIDALQILVWRNHGVRLYSGWSNASDYKDTNESFDTVALHSTAPDTALKKQWNDKEKFNQSKVKLSRDLKYLAKAMGTDLPFLPFTTKEENMNHAECALDDRNSVGFIC